MLGFAPDDLRIRDSFAYAEGAGLSFAFTPLPDDDGFEHPNTIDVILDDEDGGHMEVRGESIGGGAAVIKRIDGVDVFITGDIPSVVVHQSDKPGVLAHIAARLSEHGVNIATARLYREQRGDAAWTILETDQEVAGEVRRAIMSSPLVHDVRIMGAVGFGCRRFLGAVGESGFRRGAAASARAFQVRRLRHGQVAFAPLR